MGYSKVHSTVAIDLNIAEPKISLTVAEDILLNLSLIGDRRANRRLSYAINYNGIFTKYLLILMFP